MNRLIIVGASGHGKVVADIARLNGYKKIVFLDDNEDVKECAGYPVAGKSSEAPEGDVFIGIGDAKIRKRFMDFYKDRQQPVLIHPSAVIAKGVIIEKGTVVMAGAVVNPEVTIGKGCIINTSSSVDHDCVIGDYCHISVGAHLSGTVNVGSNSWIGTGAIISNNVSICPDTLVGAGAVVVNNINLPGVYIGIPAKKYK